ncbi:MAG TPA: hypothetical protein VGJ09_02110, partial [Bryobacteraceae bacterium]
MLNGSWALLPGVLHWLATLSTAAASLFAIATFILLVRARQHYLALPQLPPVSTGHAPPDCMVVIPARNEEGVIGAAVK